MFLEIMSMIIYFLTKCADGKFGQQAPTIKKKKRQSWNISDISKDFQNG